MEIRLSKKFNLVFALVIFILIIININTLAAGLTVSDYELNLSLNYPREVISDPVEIKSSNSEAENGTKNVTKNENVYLDKFILENSKGKEIPARYIILETPHLQKQETLDTQHRYLIMKKNQEKSWFKLGLTKEAAFFEPGEYTGIITIADLDWEINVTVLIEPFVSFSIADNTFEFEITEPFATDFFITDDLYSIDVDSNHTDWEIQTELDEFTNEQGERLNPEYLFYRLEETDRKIDINKLQKNKFSNFNEDEMIIINGSDYGQGLRAIRFGVDLARDGTNVQPSGLYSGKIIFTLRTLNNNL